MSTHISIPNTFLQWMETELLGEMADLETRTENMQKYEMSLDQLMVPEERNS